ncbi:MAG: ACP S-malonyltransferase [Hyphomicrobiales bacterium]|nr:ACP S-malonyltransferase [Hyphomicrobiales bacterium]
MSRALLFPGQGSQTPGMGKDLAENFAVARAVYDEVDAALGERLSQVIFEGPEADLTLTANAQPALMATSMAALRVLETETGLDIGRDIAFVAGHSLGEYSALAAAGALDVTTTARLLRLRGLAMQKAVPAGVGAMAALLGVEPGAAADFVAQAARESGEVCGIANDNGGGQVVISGTAAAVARGVEIAKAAGVKRAVLLPVSAPFHCTLMQPAAETMAQALAEARVNAPRVPLVANVTAAAVRDPETIRDLLVRQVTATVRWRESVLFMAGAGVNEALELGAGKVLTGLIKRISDTMTVRAIGTRADVDALKTAGESGNV